MYLEDAAFPVNVESSSIWMGLPFYLCYGSSSMDATAWHPAGKDIWGIKLCIPVNRTIQGVEFMQTPPKKDRAWLSWFWGFVIFCMSVRWSEPLRITIRVHNKNRVPPTMSFLAGCHAHYQAFCFPWDRQEPVSRLDKHNHAQPEWTCIRWCIRWSGFCISSYFNERLR